MGLKAAKFIERNFEYILGLFCAFESKIIQTSLFLFLLLTLYILTIFTMFLF